MSVWLEQLEGALLAPAHSVALPELLALWQHDDVVVICRRPSDLEDCPDLPLRIRGALGNALEALAGDRKSDVFDRPAAHSLLFKWQSPHRVSTPYVVRAEVRGDVVEVRVRLFGYAGFFAPMVLRGLVSALEGGVSVRNHGVHARFEVQSARIERFDGGGRRWPSEGSSATLQLQTPVIIRRGQHLRIEPVSLLRSALRRAQMIAPWMNCRLACDEAAMLRDAERFQFSMAGIYPESWSRTSRNNPGTPLPMNGYGGRVTIEGWLGEWASYLDLAQFGSLGGECALGFGAVSVIIYP
jgi:CRISPR-associated endoribonuclease Cas6